MNHLTNIYKHKCEQLQEQLNHLTRQLNEATRPPPIRVPRIPHIPNLPDVPPGTIARGLGNAAADAAAAAAAAAAHAAAVRAMMVTLLNDLRMLPYSTWIAIFNDVFTPIEREAFIALFGSENPTILIGSVAGVPAQFIRYMTPNGEWAVMYNHAILSGHPRWIPLTKGETPFGSINAQGFITPPPQLLNNTPEDIFVRPKPPTTPPGGGLGSQTNGPVQ